MRKAIVAGGAGFIGSHLCEYLLEKNYSVNCIDNLATGSLKNIKTFEKNENFKFLKKDVSNITVDEIEETVDEIYHLASPASPVDYLKMPLETMFANSIGTRNLLEIARIKQSGFLMASTSEIYGDPLKHPQREDYWGNVNPIGPRACYDESKRFAETITMVYRKEFRVKTHIARIFNTYGPRMRLHDGRVVPTFISQALEKQPLTIFGDGSHTRSFCFVTDLVEGLYKLMQSGVHSPVNIGNPHEISVLKFAELVKKECKSDSEIVFNDLPEDDPKKRNPNIDKAKKELNWAPKISLKEGLKNTIEFFRK